MADSDLNQPLRGRQAATPREPRPILAIALITIAAFLAVVAGLWVAIVDDPLGGQPIAIAAVQDNAPATTGSLSGRQPPGANSARRERAAGTSNGEFEVAALPHAPPPPVTTPPDDMIEPSAFGPLPKIGTNGLRPMDAYRRPAPDNAGPGTPRIVIVVGGLGLSQTGTQNAIDVLPEEITLAFAPYGASLQRWVDRARGEGHEVLLQIPMEPLDYPETDPGEHTLLASADSAAVDRDLQWSLGRMTSYTGVMNYMGARFTAEYDALGNLLASLSERGLFYFDDGSSPKSLANVAGMELGAPVIVADAVVDADRDPEQVAQALLELEAKARTDGLAVGVASGFAASVAAIASWAPEAQARGIVLVPASAAVAR